MFVTNWISTTKIQKISEITNFFRHYFLSRTEVNLYSPWCVFASGAFNITGDQRWNRWGRGREGGKALFTFYL